jgi:hypothetical protein
VPYWPALKTAVGSVNAALVVTYLEMHYPSPPPEPGHRYGLPVTVDFARMADDLAVDRRTLGLALMCVCTWWETEVKRIGAVRAGREFLNLKHSRFPRLKLYSIVADREWKSLRMLTLRRNDPQIAKTLADAGITSICTAPGPSSAPRQLPRQDLQEFVASALPLSGLTEILMRASTLAGDRPYATKPKLRGAIKREVATPDAPRVQRQRETQAIDPDLPDAMLARMDAASR